MIRALFGRREDRRPQHWGRSSVGRASRSQCEGQGFDPPRLHHFPRLDFVWTFGRRYAVDLCRVVVAGCPVPPSHWIRSGELVMPDCFVIQPFDSGEYDKRFTDIYEPALKKEGLNAYRVDQDPSADKLVEEIEARITKAAMCLADISTDNPNVWYELGYAFAVGCPVIMICSDKRNGKFPFDIQHRNITQYSSESVSDFKRLEEKISERASALLTKNLSLKQVAETEKVAPIRGLSQHELLVLVNLAGETAIPDSTMSLHYLQREAERSGLTSVAFGLAVRRPIRKKFVETREQKDKYEHDTYVAMNLTDYGWEWVDNNEELVIIHKNKRPESEGDYDDIPF